MHATYWIHPNPHHLEMLFEMLTCIAPTNLDIDESDNVMQTAKCVSLPRGGQQQGGKVWLTLMSTWWTFTSRRDPLSKQTLCRRCSYGIRAKQPKILKTTIIQSWSQSKQHYCLWRGTNPALALDLIMCYRYRHVDWVCILYRHTFLINSHVFSEPQQFAPAKLAHYLFLVDINVNESESTDYMKLQPICRLIQCNGRQLCYQPSRELQLCGARCCRNVKR